MNMPPLPSLLPLGCVLAIATAATAQCAPQWLAGDAAPGVDGTARTSCLWDPDGPGPATPVVVVGGLFTTAGNARVRNLAVHDPVTGVWSDLGGGTDYTVSALLPLPNGDLVVGGAFTHAGNVSVNSVARWDGASWHAFGGGLSNGVSTLQLLPNGDVVAGGAFWSPVRGIARWNGTQWLALAPGFQGTAICSARLTNGDLVFGGNRSILGSQQLDRLVRWNGTAWSTFPAIPDSGSTVNAIAELPNGDLIVGTDHRVVRWDGTNWTSFGFYATVQAIRATGGASFVVGGQLNLPGNTAPTHVAAFDGINWSAVGGDFSSLVFGLGDTTTGDLLATGQFRSAAGVATGGVAAWNGTTWRPLEQSTDGTFFTFAPRAGGYVVGGDFTRVAGVPARNVALRHNGAWQALGSGVDGAVHASAVLPDASVVVAGDFHLAGGVAAPRIARWNGTNWQPLGSGCNAPVHALAVMPNGDVIAAGDFTMAGGQPIARVARWTGLWWTPLGGGVDNRAAALLVTGNGDLLVGGAFAHAGGVPAQNIARWNGTTWSPLGSGVPFAVEAVAELPNGHIVAAGTTTYVAGGSVAIFDGTAWTVIGSGLGSVSALAVLPGGDLVIAGDFSSSQSTLGNYIARWNGTAWTTIGAGLDAAAHAAAMVDGQLVVAGAFTKTGDVVSARLAHLASSCPASAQPFGAGCPGSAGTPTLTASLPWLGETCRLNGTGVPNTALAAGLVGLSPQNVPLATLHPAAGPTCQWLTTADAVVALVPIANRVAWQFALPNDPAFVGVTVAGQVLVAEFAGINPTALTSSNAITLTLGSF